MTTTKYTKTKSTPSTEDICMNNISERGEADKARHGARGGEGIEYYVGRRRQRKGENNKN